jgi:hypothetical protein
MPALPLSVPSVISLDIRAVWDGKLVLWFPAALIDIEHQQLVPLRAQSV